jgi:hypothetical protein
VTLSLYRVCHPTISAWTVNDCPLLLLQLDKILKFWWHDATLFVYFDLIYITYIHLFHPIHTVHTSFVIRRAFSPSPYRWSVNGINLPGVPSRESNSGLPYSKPMHNQLSYAAPIELHCTHELRRTYELRRTHMIYAALIISPSTYCTY